MSVELRFESDTVNCPFVDGSAPLVVVAIVTSAVSSSPMVSEAESLSASMAMLGLAPVNVAMTVSVGSTRLSSVTRTSMVAEFVPARMVTLPLSAV